MYLMKPLAIDVVCCGFSSEANNSVRYFAAWFVAVSVFEIIGLKVILSTHLPVLIL